MNTIGLGYFSVKSKFFRVRGQYCANSECVITEIYSYELKGKYNNLMKKKNVMMYV